MLVSIDEIKPSILPKPFIELSKYPADAFDEYLAERKIQEMYPDIEDEDSVYESIGWGATITQTDTFYPESECTVTRTRTKRR